MQPIDPDLTYIRSSVRDLEEYLLSSVLFWPLSARGRGKLPAGATQLTIGTLLLSLKRLQAAAFTGQVEMEEIDQMAAEIQTLRRRWKSNWDKKANQEVHSRLNQWDHYVSELSSGESKHGDYPYNIRQRVILGLLLDDLEFLDLPDQAHLDGLDQRLRNLTRPASFVWDDTLQMGFPQDVYWYLYRAPV